MIERKDLDTGVVSCEIKSWIIYWLILPYESRYKRTDNAAARGQRVQPGTLNLNQMYVYRKLLWTQGGKWRKERINADRFDLNAHVR